MENILEKINLKEKFSYFKKLIWLFILILIIWNIIFFYFFNWIYYFLVLIIWNIILVWILVPIFMWIWKTYLIESGLKIAEKTKEDFWVFNSENIVKIIKK